MAIAWATRTARLGLPMLAINYVGKAVSSFNGANYNIATIATIATVRAPLGNVLLPAKAPATGTAVTTFDKQCDPINKHPSFSLQSHHFIEVARECKGFLKRHTNKRSDGPFL
jgi:hypothetical protein